MKLDDQNEAMARMDGYTVGDKITFPQYFYKNAEIFTMNNQGGQPHLPDYGTDNEMDRMVRGLSDDELFEYMNLLHEVTGSDMVYETDPLVFKAEPAQKREAFLKAKGEWQSE